MSNNAIATARGARPEREKEQFWRRTLGDFAASGQSVRAFCRARGLAEPSFYAWRRTLAQRDADCSRAALAAAAAPAFLPIRLTGAVDVPSDAPFEIVLVGGHRVRVRPPVDRAALAEIVAALQFAHAASEPGEA